MKKNCEICSKEFEGRTSLAKFCSKECKNKNHNNVHGKPSTFDGFCFGCKIDISDRKSKRSRYCTEECKQKHEMKQEVKKRLEKIKTCLNCNINYNNTSSSSKFCSMKCMGEHIKEPDVKLNCTECKKEYNCIYHKRNKSKFCSRECAGIFNNKNLTEEKSKEKSLKMSKSLKQHYKENDHPWIGKNHSEVTKDKTRKTRKERGLDQPEKNPMFGKKHSTETKEAISKTRSERIVAGDYSLWFKKGNYFSTKLNRELTFQSSWEEKAFKYLDSDETVLTYLPQPFLILYKYDHNRNYIPDILVTYTNGNQKLIEIKPTYFLEAAINKAKFEAAKNYCNERNIQFEVWTEKEGPYILIKETNK